MILMQDRLEAITNNKSNVIEDKLMKLIIDIQCDGKLTDFGNVSDTIEYLKGKHIKLSNVSYSDFEEVRIDTSESQKVTNGDIYTTFAVIIKDGRVCICLETYNGRHEYQNTKYCNIREKALSMTGEYIDNDINSFITILKYYVSDLELLTQQLETAYTKLNELIDKFNTALEKYVSEQENK